ncbi:MAG: hypothetical protein DME18_05070 [Verrucomicrobia bacterium]|nr:MAG: hypothetical protein DME18_05070 [Verrucomicrobiota bacterium]
MQPADISAALKRIDPSVIALVAANLVPLVGVFVFRWEVFPLLFLFWLENIVVGVSNVLKMLFAAPRDPARWAAKLFFIPFFCVHYGGFTAVHGALVIAFFGGGLKDQRGLVPSVDALYKLVTQNHLGWALLGLAVSHGISFGHNYLWRGEYREAKLQSLMNQPYGRVMVLHLTILGGGFLMLALHSPLAGLALLVLLKLVLDLRAHWREREKFAPQKD